MRHDRPKVDLNIYLLKEGRRAIDTTTRGLRTYELTFGANHAAMLYAKAAPATTPRWAKFFEEVIDPARLGRNSSTAALLLIEAAGREFALAFGQGRHLLQLDSVESNFGLRVTLNLVDENSLRSIDKATFEEHPRQSREQTGRAGQLEMFTVDVERDLLRAVTGSPVHERFGSRVSGMDSLKLSLETRLSDLPALLTELLNVYASDDYKLKGFAFVDHIQPIRDSALVDGLDAILITQMNRGQHSRIWLAAPEIVDWDRAVGFKYSAARLAARVHDVRLDELLQEFGDVDASVLLRKKIFCVDAEDMPVFSKPAYFWIYAEIESAGKTHLLNNGKWYAVDTDYVGRVNAFYDQVPRYTRALPSFESNDQTEGPYNERVARTNSAEFALLDKQNIRLPGAVSAVEPCDLYRCSKEFIHVKRYCASSVLSHLFNQGVVSADLFKRETAFRRELNARLPVIHRIADIEATPQQGEYSVVYAIVSEHDEDLSIPFFSKITLRHALQRLMSLGFSVALAPISVDEDWKILRVVPAARTARRAQPLPA
jgi:uncharacterized protein (TIGR04141 family)